MKAPHADRFPNWGSLGISAPRARRRPRYTQGAAQAIGDWISTIKNSGKRDFDEIRGLKKRFEGLVDRGSNLPNVALSGDQNQTSMPLEVLNSSFVLLGGLARHERSEILSLASPWIFLSRVQAVLSGL